ncbi:Major sperm protein isoform beta domain protein [Brugia pahangi]|nr:unnamed protein product [Brugia pahangi]
MAQSIPPGDIHTQPGSKIVFNAPYDDKHTYHIKITNAGGRRIGWAIKTTNMRRLGVDPPCGVLDPKENVLMAVSCDTFDASKEDINNDRITIEWTNTPDGAAKQFRREWFQGDVKRQRYWIFLMAQSVPPGDIHTQPGSKIVFNAPYDDKHTYHIKITNAGGRRIGWAIKTTNMRRLGVDPPCGVLDPKENVLMAVSCDTFDASKEDINNDRITIEWTNTPDGAAKQFRREWFQGDGMVRRKNLPIEYNL